MESLESFKNLNKDLKEKEAKTGPTIIKKGWKIKALALLMAFLPAGSYANVEKDNSGIPETEQEQNSSQEKKEKEENSPEFKLSLVKEVMEHINEGAWVSGIKTGGYIFISEGLEKSGEENSVINIHSLPVQEGIIPGWKGFTIVFESNESADQISKRVEDGSLSQGSGSIIVKYETIGVGSISSLAFTYNMLRNKMKMSPAESMALLQKANPKTDISLLKASFEEQRKINGVGHREVEEEIEELEGLKNISPEEGNSK